VSLASRLNRGMPDVPQPWRIVIARERRSVKCTIAPAHAAAEIAGGARPMDTLTFSFFCMR
jgi:hypothetical protein